MPVRLQIRAVVTVCVVGLVLGLLGALGTSASAGQRTDWSTKVVPPAPGHVDPAPPGVDVKRKLRTDELRARAKARSERRLARIKKSTGRSSHQLFAVNTAPQTAAANTPAGVSALPDLATHVDTSCTGTGVDGNRVQALYVVEADDTDRFTGVLPILREELANVDDTFALSAAQTGGGVRVRWVLDPMTCQPVIERLQVPAGALTSFTGMIAAAKAAGYTAVNRKYLMFADAAVMCGIGHLFDDSSRSGNLNDGAAAMYSRVDTGCWQAGDHGSTAAHELMHNIGGVQQSAQNSTTAGHCDDDSDLMCYADGTGVTMNSVCATTNEPLFDCRNDDYFSTNPAPGSYLATSWNTADSSFLDRVPSLNEVDPVAPVGDEPAAPAPTVTVSGPATVRPGLPATLTATGSAQGTVTWTLGDARCLNGSTATPTLVVQCPSYRSGAVRATATFTDAGGRTAQAVHDVEMGGTPAPLTLSLTPSGGTHYVGAPLRLTTRVAFGSAPVRGWVALWSSTDGVNWRELTGAVDTGPDGVLVTTVKPARRTSYTAAVSAGPGWVPAANQVISVPVVKRPVRLSSSARSGRPDVVTGRLTSRVDGSPLAGRKLTLQKRLYGTSAWRSVATVRTGDRGYAKARVQPRRKAYFRWVYAGSPTYASRTSGRVFLRY